MMIMAANVSHLFVSIVKPSALFFSTPFVAGLIYIKRRYNHADHSIDIRYKDYLLCRSLNA